MFDRISQFFSLCRSLGVFFTIKYKLGLVREGKDFVTCGQTEYQPLRGPWKTCLEGEYYCVSQYDAFAKVAFYMLGESLAEDLNDALHLYAAHPEVWGCPLIDPANGDMDFVELLAAFDRVGLNFIKPEYDVLRGGSLADK